MRKTLALGLLLVVGLSGCGIEEAIRKNDDRYLQPGALDMPRTGIYKTYQYNLVQRYRITHQWPNTTSCAYRATELPDLPEGGRSNFFVVPDIFEAQGKTMQASNVGLKPMDFDPWVRSVKEVSREKGKEGQIREVGLRPVCFDYWWKTSHFLDLSLRKSTLQAFELHLSKHYQKARWSTRQINGHAWRVAEVLNNDLDPKPLNGIGGPYQAWLTALGDSGYVMSIEMGASRESLAHPQAHAEVEAVLHHLVRSLKVEQIAP